MKKDATPAICPVILKCLLAGNTSLTDHFYTQLTNRNISQIDLRMKLKLNYQTSLKERNNSWSEDFTKSLPTITKYLESTKDVNVYKIFPYSELE